MDSELKINLSDDEDGEGNSTLPSAPASNTSLSSPKTPASPHRSTRPSSVYVAYPRPVGQPLGSNATPLMPSTVGRHNGFLRTYKVLVVGEAGVGKSNLMHRYCYNKYDPSLPSTLGAEFCSREVDIPTGPVGQTQSVVLQLWDTAGQERNAGVISNAFYRNAVGAIVVYDVTRRESLLNVPRWVARVMELAREECVCVVVGAKLDLLKTPQGTPLSTVELEALQQEADRISHALGTRNFLTSALSGDGVLEAFTHLVLAVDAVQAAPPEVHRDAAHPAQHPHHSNTNEHAMLTFMHGGRGMVPRQDSEMWTAASTVPASPVALFGSPTSRPLHDDGAGMNESTASSAAAAAAATTAQCSPAMTPSASGYMSPGTAGNTSQWRSPSSSPGKQKKALDLRGFGPGGGGGAPAPTTNGGFVEPSWGC